MFVSLLCFALSVATFFWVDEPWSLPSAFAVFFGTALIRAIARSVFREDMSDGVLSILIGRHMTSEGMATGEINSLLQDAQVDKEAQMRVLKPVIFVAAIIVFFLCFWQWDIGLPLSIGAAILTIPTVGFPIGYIFGKHAARRLRTRMRDVARKSNPTSAPP